jgi:hypothetical protein
MQNVTNKYLKCIWKPCLCQIVYTYFIKQLPMDPHLSSSKLMYSFPTFSIYGLRMHTSLDDMTLLKFKEAIDNYKNERHGTRPLAY